MAIKALTQLTVPKEPDTIYARPALPTWPFCILRNRTILLNQPSLLAEGRNELISLSMDYTTNLTGNEFSYDHEQSIIATGHQPNWHHCGIFIKSLIGVKLANRMDGLFIHVVLDHDITDTSLLLPEEIESGLLDLSSITFNHHKPGIPTERIRHDEEALKTFLTHCINTTCNTVLFKGVWEVNHLENFFSENSSASDCLIYLLDALYQNLGIQIAYLPVSRISESTAFHDFCVDLFSNLTSFVGHYNNAISTSINFTGISMLQTKLFQGQLFTELPFWLLSPENKRETLWASFDAVHEIKISSETEILATIKIAELNLLFEKLKHKGYLIRPKAILLTCFLRLYLCDWFIHGIGGSRYETISDYLLKHYWNIDGLSYGIASLTSYLFDNMRIASEKDLNILCEQHRKFTHKPESLFNTDPYLTSKYLTLIQEKEGLVTHSSNIFLPSHERQKAWKRNKVINQELQALLPCSEESFLNKIHKHKNQLNVFNKRDFFFGLFPKDYLNSFSEAINAEFQ